MTVQYWPSGRRAREIAADVERALASRQLQPGDRLPAVRTLASRLAVSPATVAAAYQELGRRGVARSEGRRGTRVSPRPPIASGGAYLSRGTDARPQKRRSDAGSRANRMRDLSIGNPDPALLPDPSAALAEAGAQLHDLYGQAPIDEQLMGWASRDLARDGIDVGAVTVVSGALDGVERVLEARSRPGDVVAVEDPGYPPLFDLLAALDLRAAPVPVDAAGMAPDPLARALEAGARAMVLTPRAQNPTGAALDPERAKALGQVLANHPEVLVIEDDHAGPVSGAPARTLTAGRERWAVVRSVGKSLGPDFRLAVLAGDELTVARVEGRLRLGPGWVSRYLQRAAALLASDREVQASLRRAARTYRDRRQALRDALSAHGLEAHGHTGMNVWVPVADEAAVVGHVGAAGWTLAPGGRFRLGSGPGVRVTVAALPVEDAPAVADVIADAVSATWARSASRLG